MRTVYPVLLCWTSVRCFVNLVHDQGFSGTAEMNLDAFLPRWGALKAVDGNTNQDINQNSCAIGGISPNPVWWKVWLQHSFNIAYIEIYFRTDAFYRSTGFSIYIFNDSNYHPPSNSGFIYHHEEKKGCIPENGTMNITLNKISQGVAYFNTLGDRNNGNCIKNNDNVVDIGICEVRVMGCEQNRYGYGCILRCPEKCKNRQCDAFNGTCIYGCNDPFAETPFCQDCLQGYYKDNDHCVKCGNCKDNSPCDKDTGDCIECQSNWKPPRCNECKNGFYGKNCSKQCGNCLQGFCNKENGICNEDGCILNWEMPFCKECVNGYYDENCSTPCGNCDKEFCDKKNGSCLSGCKQNWQEPLCQECVDGYYDRNCSTKCGNCLKGSCDKTNGSCLSGCKLNWKEPLCQECVNGYYDENCSTPCGNCAEGFCDMNNGSCLSGCKLNWQEPLCQECVKGHYDENCSTPCGNCAKGFCDQKNGSCLSGCKLNWQEPLCRECVDGYFDQNCSTQCGNCLQGFCDKYTGSCSSGCKSNWEEPLCQECADGFYDKNCSQQCGKCLDGFCHKTNGTCLRGCLQNWQGPFCQAQEQAGDNNATVIGGTLSAVFIAVLVAVFILVFYRRRRNKESKAGTTRSFTHFGLKGWTENTRNRKEHEAEAYDGVCDPVTSELDDDDGYYNTFQFNTDIRIEDLQNVINEKDTEGNNQFHQEYKKLPTANLNVCESARKTENTAKNRFKATFPYEHSRIILKEIWAESDNDYINASYITDCSRENRYIAAQGPKSNTLRDFWRMIWQEDIKDIVMLTNIVENGKNKCTKYWPDKDKSMQFGPCYITLREETVYAFQTVRKLAVERKQPTSKRIITQYHYTAWPDHGTPQELELVQFHRFVSKRIHTDVPLLVHCSAGVGRTGTFIGLDSLLTQGRETGRINVFEFVKQMRENRMTMVQTPEQYVFLHEALDCGFQGDFRLSEDEFSTKMESLLNDSAPLNQRALYQEFKLLDTLKPNYSCLDNKEARSSENANKNYSKDMLPVSKYRAYLTTYVSGRNDYINAVIVPSYINPSGLIITQKPFQNTQVDLWRLCIDHEVSSLVVINTEDEANDWLPKRGVSKASIPFTITVGDTGSNIGGVSQDKLVISSDDVKKEVKVFQVQTNDNDALVKATELVLETMKQSTFTSVVISKDGAGPAGIFCVLHNALQQINMDGEVDIFTIARQLKVRRPEVITKLEEYRRCYQLVSQSFSTEGIYANM